MGDIWQGRVEACWLVATLDPDLVEITLRSLQVSLTAGALACAMGIPLGAWLAIKRFR